MKRINKESPLLDDDPEINNYDVGQEETFDLIIRKLSEQQTAYDVEKVVEQLEELQQYYIYSIDDLVRLKEVKDLIGPVNINMKKNNNNNIKNKPKVKK